METTFVSPGRLTDEELLARVHCLALREHDTTALLVVHLAELDERRLHVPLGYPSLFAWCTGVLRQSEDAAYSRIVAARAGRRFPLVFEMLTARRLHLTAVRKLAPHLTEANHRELLERAQGLAKGDLERLIAEIEPLPDVQSTVRKLPARRVPARTPSPVAPTESPDGSLFQHASREDQGGVEAPPRSLVAPLSPERYRIQFTASRETYERLQRVRNLMRHRVPDGDPAEIFAEALIALEEKIARQKLAATKRPKRVATVAATGGIATPSSHPSRHIPAEVRRKVWARDGGRCAYRAPDGRRCTERGFLEFHHLEPFAVGGSTIADNLALRCRVHNRYEAERTLGVRTVRRAMEVRAGAPGNQPRAG